MRPACLSVVAFLAILHGAGRTLPDFEAVSIRMHTAADSESSTAVFPGGRLTAVNLTVRKMLRNAFGVEDYQISGAPRWVDSAKYDIEAKMPAGVEITRDDIPALLASCSGNAFSCDITVKPLS
jgi:hypothetical protein